MNKKLLSLGIVLGSSFFTLANAANPGPTPQAPLPSTSYTVEDLAEAIDIIEIERGDDDCPIGRVFLARGVQVYQTVVGGSGKLEWRNNAPSAELFNPIGDLIAALEDPDDTPIAFDESTVAGTHYDVYKTHDATADPVVYKTWPAWEFDGQRLIAQGATPLPSPLGYIAWLNVLVDDSAETYDRVYRVLTNGGVAPKYHGQLGTTVGSPYTTIYVVLNCTIPE